MPCGIPLYGLCSDLMTNNTENKEALQLDCLYQLSLELLMVTMHRQSL